MCSMGELCILAESSSFLKEFSLVFPMKYTIIWRKVKLKNRIKISIEKKELQSNDEKQEKKSIRVLLL